MNLYTTLILAALGASILIWFAYLLPAHAEPSAPSITIGDVTFCGAKSSVRPWLPSDVNFIWFPAEW
jgi:hypothetical protein